MKSKTLYAVIAVILLLCPFTRSAAQSDKFSLHMDNVPIKVVLDEIQSKTSYAFFYNNAEIDDAKIVSVSADNQTIPQILSQIIPGVTCQFEKMKIVLGIAKTPARDRNSGPFRIGGLIRDDTGGPLAGAAIIVNMDGKNIGSVADINGKFSMELPHAPAGNQEIRFSCLGFSDIIESMNGRSDYQVTMQPDTQMLAETVVVGYGVQRKSDITGAISSVNMEETLKKMPASKVEDLLQGRVAGMSVVSTSGAPGATPNIRIRGVNSIKADGGPLVVIDGFPGGSLNSVSPNDIKSIEVLKDASSTAIYGSRGANGVIIITTKSPEEGKISVNYNGYVDAGTPANMPELMPVGEFANMANEWYRTFYGKNLYNKNQITNFVNGYDTYDYLGNVFNKVAVSTTHDLSVTGGTRKAKYMFSIKYAHDSGIVGVARNDMFNYRAKLDFEIVRTLTAGVNFFGRINDARQNAFSGAYSILTLAQEFPQTVLPYDKDGKLTRGTISNSSMYNPMGFIDEQRNMNNEDKTFNNWLQAYVNWEIIPGLNLRHDEQFNFTNRYYGTTSSAQSYSGSLKGKSLATYYDSNAWGWKQMTTLNYTKEFNRFHRINATLGFESSLSNTQYVKLEAEGLTTTAIGWKNLMLSETSKITDQNVSTTTALSFFARVNYALLGRYILTATVRRDGSSLLAYENRWDTFPSFSAAWNIKEERWMKSVDAISNFKIRYGYGISGNQAVAAYSAFTTYSATIGSGGTIAYSLVNGNPNLRWEKTYQHNVGLDMAFLKDRITLSTDFYDKVTDNAINQIVLPADMGMTSGLRNAVSIGNRGFEIGIGAVAIDKKDFYWKIDASFATNNAVINSLGDIESDYMELGTGWGNAFFRFYEGQPLGTIYGLKCLGLWTSAEMSDPNVKKPTSPVVRAGSYKYEDVNIDGLINTDDYQIIGNGQAKFNWGLNNTFNFKGFDLSIFFIGYHGFDIYNYPEARLTSQCAPVSALSDRFVVGTREDARIASFGPNRDAITSYDSVASSNFVEKGDFVKLKNVTLGYTFSKPRLRIYLAAKNLFTITSYSGNDPELAIGNPLRPGLDMGTYPAQHEFIFGANITF